METRSEEEVMLELLDLMDKHVPTIPDELVAYYLQKTGFNCPDVRVTRLVSLATQKFLTEITNDAFDHCKLRMVSNKDKKNANKLTLTVDDVVHAVQEYGIHIRKPDYYADSAADDSTSHDKK
eukprot:TRINITY_DN6314_c0_g1::TRINITY_DN6314_c0_g1_i1::g.519::m.519 TRINITY_DN6314_c0_g1::TRINITY_DN6314_c0_g1_i1::g.519  ORF type:complete len:123 (+),score=-0.31,sp/O04173/TAF10_ARATH/45.22/4e-28,TFIID_30kDa/PF03540.8/4.6e-24,Bromo_TP/PF07524.8/8.9e+03,Bromo_TP/PF07524.8/0.044,PgpA/PF04608.8/0.074,DUF2203/PF09969.4/0.11 TRINITY_DN6314_c0_g1_i1:96-464(+)